MSVNGFFHNDDPRAEEVGGMTLLPSWWSRPYEYFWARKYAVEGHVVADMGCGWSGRPFKEELADRGCEVWAIDGDPRVLELPPRDGVKLVVRKFLEPMDDFPQFDTIFCLSVLEDLTKDLDNVLYAFAKKLKPDGVMVVTFDTPYDVRKPTPVYPGLSVAAFMEAAMKADLKVVGDVDVNRDNLVNHQEWNLAVTHWLLAHA